MPWPKNYVLGGSTKSRISYDELTMSQWVAGFCNIVKNKEENWRKLTNLTKYVELMHKKFKFTKIATHVGFKVRIKLSPANFTKKVLVLVVRYTCTFVHKKGKNNPHPSKDCRKNPTKTIEALQLKILEDCSKLEFLQTLMHQLVPIRCCIGIEFVKCHMLILSSKKIHLGMVL